MTRAFCLIVNPTAAGGQAVHRTLPVADALRRRGAVVEVMRSRSARDAVEQARKAGHRGEVAVAAGGDGMVGVIAGAAIGDGFPIGVIPAGRGNDFARQLGVDLTGDAQAIASALLERSERRVDVIEAPERIVVGSVYAGIDSRASELASRMRFVPSSLQYRVAGMRAIATYRPHAFTIEIDGVRHEHRAAMVVIANSGFYGSGMHIAPDARVDDGLLDIVIVGVASRAALLRAMPRLYDGSHVELEQVTVLRGREVTLDTGGGDELEAHADGDRLHVLPVRLRLLPGALRVVG